MLTILHTDLFTSQATLTNPVNCEGVMGKGVALIFRQRYPDLLPAYQQACRTGDLAIGKPWLWQHRGISVLCFPTKDRWRLPSRFEYIDAGLAFLAAHYHQMGIANLSLPALGCGLGGLALEQVLPLIQSYLDPLPIETYLHLPT